MIEYLETGKIVNTHGIKGEMKMIPWCDGIDFLKCFEYLYLDDKGSNRVTIESVKSQKSNILIKFKEYNSIEEAETLKNHIVYCKRSDAPIDDDENFIVDLIGCSVIDLNTNENYGIVNDVVNYGSCDIYEVKNDNKMIMIPVIEDIVKSIDIDKQEIKIIPMKGLFDEN